MPTTYLIDTHCHLHDREFFTSDQAEQFLQDATTRNVQQIICIGTSHDDSLAARDFTAAHPGVFWTYGIHPSETNGGLVKTPEKDFLEAIRENLRNMSFEGHFSLLRKRSDEPRKDGREERPEKDIFANSQPIRARKNSKSLASPIAIGEVGLDYHYSPYNRSAQIRLLEQMLQLAIDHNLPVSFHVREAFDDFFPVVANFSRVTGVIHSFSDSKRNLRRILETTDFYIGVNGLATYSTLPTPPLERTLLETDAPFLTPTPNRGKINSPAYIADIAAWVSSKLGVEPALVAKETTQNARRLFNLPSSVIRPS